MTQLDRERSSYGLKEANLGKMLSEALGLSKQAADRLYHYKNPSFHPKNAEYIGDFVFVMKAVIGPFCRKESSLTLQQVDDFLEEVSTADDKTKHLYFSQLIRQSTASDLEWVCRIILKDLKVGIRHEKLLAAYHPDALAQFNFSFNLRRVCEACADLSAESGSAAAGICLFQPVRPQLAARKNLEESMHLFASTKYLIETKYDGERVQVHFDEESLKVFSRNNHDVTSVYGRHLSKWIREGVSAKAGILDGELAVVDRLTFKTVEFGKNKTVAAEENHERYTLCCSLGVTQTSCSTCCTCGGSKEKPAICS